MTEAQEFNFGPAALEEQIVFGACRPGDGDSRRLERIGAHVPRWITFMKSQGIERVVCLLPDADPMLDSYRKAFGPQHVLHEPVVDYTLPSGAQLETILSFLRDADRSGNRVVVHCAGGVGRTGVVLTAWLIAGRGLRREEAVAAVKGAGAQRNPHEAALAGGATTSAIEALLDGCGGDGRA